MNNRKFVSLILSVVFIIVYTSSCRSVETEISLPSDNTSPAAISTIANGNFGGILYDDSRTAAATAAHMPGMTYTRTSVSDTDAEPDLSDSDETAEPDSDPEEQTSDTTTSAASATTSTTKQTSAAPDMVITETTTAAAVTTTTSATPVTTSEADTTTTTAAATTTAAGTTAPAPASTVSYAKNTYSALNHSYVKAVWISYIELSVMYKKNEEEFTKAFAQMLDNCVSLGLNTVFVHVRAFGDAYYYSELYPFTKQLTGTLDKRTDFDPLKIMISEAHSRSLSFHAWINPLRLGVAADMPSVPQGYAVGKWYNGAENGKYIVNVNGTYYLNPAYPEVRRLIGDGVREIVSRYNVDGIHIDDYFYPTTDISFDSAAYGESGYSSVESFRVDCCTAMVKEIHTAAHECGSALFGAAPQGNNYNNLYTLYADTKAWAKNGCVDYFVPQIYYGFENGAVPFAGNVDEWLEIVRGTGIRLITGLAAYKCGAEDKWAGTGKSEWQNTDTMLRRQKEYADKAGCSGIALYSYNYLFSPSYTNAAIGNEISNLKPLLTE